MTSKAPGRLLLLKLHCLGCPAGDWLLKAVPVEKSTVPLEEATLLCLRELVCNVFDGRLGETFSLLAEVDFGDGLELSSLRTESALNTALANCDGSRVSASNLSSSAQTDFFASGSLSMYARSQAARFWMSTRPLPCCCKRRFDNCRLS